MLVGFIVGIPVAGFAQTRTEALPGLLGQKYVELSAGGLVVDRSSGNGFAAGFRLSVPVLSLTDVSLGYESRDGRPERLISSYQLKEKSDAAHLDVTQSFAATGIKPFVTAGLSYRTIDRHLTFLGYTFSNARDREGEWRVGLGAEIPVSTITVTPTIRYYQGITKSHNYEEGYLTNDDPRGLRFSVEAHTWLTTTLGTFAGVEYDRPSNDLHIAVPVAYPDIFPPPANYPGYADVHLGSSNPTWLYRAGVRVRF